MLIWFNEIKINQKFRNLGFNGFYFFYSSIYSASDLNLTSLHIPQPIPNAMPLSLGWSTFKGHCFLFLHFFPLGPTLSWQFIQ